VSLEERVRRKLILAGILPKLSDLGWFCIGAGALVAQSACGPLSDDQDIAAQVKGDLLQIVQVPPSHTLNIQRSRLLG
jgi:hypothetical protein